MGTRSSLALGIVLVVVGAFFLVMRIYDIDLSTYGFLGDGRIACTVIENAVHSFAVLDPATRELERLDLPFTASAPSLRAEGKRFAALAATPLEAPAIVVVDVESGEYETALATQAVELLRVPDARRGLLRGAVLALTDRWS